MKTYLALIGDIVESRAVEPRAELQQRLEQALEGLNQSFSSPVVAKFLVTIGDEFQGLLGRVDELDILLATLRSELHPVELRFGLGIGGLTTPLQERAIGMDGPAFHRARDAIESARSRATPVEVGSGSSHDRAFSIYSLLYVAIRRGWTARQRLVFDLITSGLDGVQVAEQLDITPSAVSQHLSSTAYKAISEARAEWLSALREALETEEDRA